MPDVGSGSYTAEDLMRIGIEVGKRYASQGGEDKTPTQWVVEVLRPYAKTMTDQHVRRVCENAYHAIFKAKHTAARPSGDLQKYVSFDPPDAETAATALGVRRVPSIAPDDKPTKPGYPGERMDKKASVLAHPTVVDASTLVITGERTFRVADVEQTKAASAIDSYGQSILQKIQERDARIAHAAAARPVSELYLSTKIAHDDLAGKTRALQTRVDLGIQSVIKSANDLCAAGANSRDVMRIVSVGMEKAAEASDEVLVILQAIGDAIHAGHPFYKSAEDPREVSPEHWLAKRTALLGEDVLSLVKHAQALGDVTKQCDRYRQLMVAEADADLQAKQAAQTPDLRPAARAVVGTMANSLIGMGAGVTTPDRDAQLRTAEERGKAQFRGALAGTAAGAAVGLFSDQITNTVRSGVQNMLAKGGVVSPTVKSLANFAALAAPNALAASVSRLAARGAHLTVGRNGIPVSQVAPPIDGAHLPPAAPSGLISLTDTTQKAASNHQDNVFLRSLQDSTHESGVYRVPDHLKAHYGIADGEDGWRAFSAQEVYALKSAGAELVAAPPDVRAAYAAQLFGVSSPPQAGDDDASLALKLAAAPMMHGSPDDYSFIQYGDRTGNMSHLVAYHSDLEPHVQQADGPQMAQLLKEHYGTRALVLPHDATHEQFRALFVPQGPSAPIAAPTKMANYVTDSLRYDVLPAIGRGAMQGAALGGLTGGMGGALGNYVLPEDERIGMGRAVLRGAGHGAAAGGILGGLSGALHGASRAYEGHATTVHREHMDARQQDILAAMRAGDFKGVNDKVQSAVDAGFAHMDRRKRIGQARVVGDVLGAGVIGGAGAGRGFRAVLPYERELQLARDQETQTQKTAGIGQDVLRTGYGAFHGMREGIGAGAASGMVVGGASGLARGLYDEFNASPEDSQGYIRRALGQSVRGAIGGTIVGGTLGGVAGAFGGGIGALGTDNDPAVIDRIERGSRGVGYLLGGASGASAGLTPPRPRTILIHDDPRPQPVHTMTPAMGVQGTPRQSTGQPGGAVAAPTSDDEPHPEMKVAGTIGLGQGGAGSTIGYGDAAGPALIGAHLDAQLEKNQRILNRLGNATNGTGGAGQRKLFIPQPPSATLQGVRRGLTQVQDGIDAFHRSKWGNRIGGGAVGAAGLYAGGKKLYDSMTNPTTGFAAMRNGILSS